MDKVEAVQRILRFSDAIREWVETEHRLYFDDFDDYNVADYEGGYGEIADEVIKRGIAENILEESDIA